MTHCEGWRRHGGAFTLGPVKWVQCPNKATVMIEAKQKDEEGISCLPACAECWQECIDNKHIEILKVTPIRSNDADKTKETSV